MKHILRAVAMLVLSLVTAAPVTRAQATQAADLSANWAGLVATNAYYTGVTALIQAPTPAALQSLGVAASWVGIGGSDTPDLIQAGVQEVNQGPFFSYQAWYEMLPEPSRNVVMDIEPGAWILVDIHELAFDYWQITIVNGTNVVQRQVRYASSHSSAEWIVEEPSLLSGRQLPLAGITGANFAKMSAIANGVTAIPAQLFPRPVVIVSPLGTVKAVPSPLGPDGASFSVTTR